MSITGILFLFLFLPISLLLYYISNDEIKRYILLCSNIVFYSLCSLKFLNLLIISMIFTVLVGRLIYRLHNVIKRRILLIIGIVYNILILGYYKYIGMFSDVFRKIFNTDFSVGNIVLPLGISFFTFKSISYLADIYTKKVQLDDSIVQDLVYLSFFPQIQSGPLTRVGDMLSPVEKQQRGDLFSQGVYRFLIGFNKKVLLSNVLSNITSEVFSASIDLYSTSYAWLGSICFTLQLFFDFSGYSDMAIGLSNMFGYKCMENFDYPYTTNSIAKFWRRWHISLSQWFRDYIYIPLGGSRGKNKYKVYFNLLIVWTLTGIWHGASWTFVVWGLGYFVMISFEKITGLPDKIKTRAGKIIYRIFTLLFINCEWVIFKSESIIQGLRYIKTMFVYKYNSNATIRTGYLLKNYFVFLILAVILSFPIVPKIEEKIKGKSKKMFYLFEICKMVIIFALFIVSLSFVISGQNNPFAYANF